MCFFLLQRTLLFYVSYLKHFLTMHSSSLAVPYNKSNYWSLNENHQQVPNFPLLTPSVLFLTYSFSQASNQYLYLGLLNSQRHLKASLALTQIVIPIDKCRRNTESQHQASIQQEVLQVRTTDAYTKFNEQSIRRNRVFAQSQEFPHRIYIGYIGEN